MPLTITVTIANEDVPRLRAALAAAGIADGGAVIAQRIEAFVQTYEMAVLNAGYDQQVADIQAQNQQAQMGYVPITPLTSVAQG